MNTLPASFREECLAAALDLLWRQWCSLGVAGHAPPAMARHSIDPEALLLATTSLGKYEPRLLDECLDWLGQWGGLLNYQRLKNLTAIPGLGDSTVLAAIADWLVTRAGQPKWKGLADHPATGIVPLFEGAVPVEKDPVFLRQGLARPPVKLRGLSRAPDPTLAPNILLSLRALIGVSARAEVIVCLAGGAAVSPSELARLTGYSARSMQVLLQEMALSGHVLTQESPVHGTKSDRAARRLRYHLNANDWGFLTGGRPLPRWVPWPGLYAIAQEVIASVPGQASPPRHPALISSRLREVLAAHGPGLAAAGLLPALDLRAGAPGDELLATLARSLPGDLGRHVILVGGPAELPLPPRADGLIRSGKAYGPGL